MRAWGGRCISSSTSPLVHCLQILSSLLSSPVYLPVSTPNSAVPPLSFINALQTLLHPISTHLVLHRLFIISLTTLFLSSCPTLLHSPLDTVSQLCTTSPLDSLLSSSTPTPIHLISSILCFKFSTHLSFLPSPRLSTSPLLPTCSHPFS